MSPRPRFVALALCLALPLVALAAPRSARATVPESVLVIAGPLAEHYGVSGSAVTNLLQNGMSLESVTQLLLVKESSGKSFDQVTSTYRQQGDDIQKTADQLGVAADKYSAKNVQAAIDQAKADAAQSASQKASEKATETTTKAVDSLLGGMQQK